jgi:hypothetical protein
MGLFYPSPAAGQQPSFKRAPDPNSTPYFLKNVRVVKAAVVKALGDMTKHAAGAAGSASDGHADT